MSKEVVDISYHDEWNNWLPQRTEILEDSLVMTICTHELSTSIWQSHQ
jgi:hypothetical protein